MSSQIILTEESSGPSTPSTGRLAVYAKTDSKLYIKDDAGVETVVGDPTAVAVAMAIALG